MAKRMIPAGVLATLAASLLTALPPVRAAEGEVDLLFAPASQTVLVDDTVSIDIIARSSGAPVAVTALDAVIAWEPDALDLLGSVNPGFWMLCGFLSDPCGINTNGAPNAIYTALASPVSPLEVGPDGVTVTTLQFRALDPTPGTNVEYLAEVQGAGHTCRTQIFGTNGAQDNVTGDILSVATVVICQSRGTMDFDSDDDVDLADFSAFQVCFTGDAAVASFECECTFDSDGDRDVDLLDYGAFSALFGGPAGT